MFELIPLGPKTFYINCPAKIGVYRQNETDVWLIDSGNDKDAGRRVRKILDENGWQLKGIVNTHANADHIGGNRYLQQQTGCAVYAGGIEAALTRHTILEPAFLYGGYPCRDLRHKFLLADESDVLDISDKGFPPELEVIALPGHYFGMIGVRTPDNIVFLADCVSSGATLDKYHVVFIYDVAAYLETLDKVASMAADFFVPAHADVTGDMRELAGLNRRKVLEIADKLVTMCEEPRSTETIIKRVFDDYGLKMNFEQYVLVGSTLRSYLSWLRDTDRLDALFEDNRLLWRRI